MSETRNLDGDIIKQTCSLKGREGRFALIKQGPLNTRLAEINPPRGLGFLVPTCEVEAIEGVKPVIATRGESPITPHEDLPWGVHHIDPQITTDDNGQIRCFVKGCTNFLQPPTRKTPGDTCTTHRIRCHASGTYTYPKEEAFRNTIVNRCLFDVLANHPGKFENRMHYERSEDAVTASVFLGMREAGLLNIIAQWTTGIQVEEEDIRLLLWGIDVSTLEPWDLLVAARSRFERGLAQGRPYSEPDAALLCEGKFLAILEAKFTSENGYVIPGEGRKSPISLSHNEVLNRYYDLEMCSVDRFKAATSPVPQQLYRYMVLAEWMARMADAKPFLCNLTREGHEGQSQEDFKALLTPDFQDRFSTMTWEEMYVLAGFQKKKLARLRAYLSNKTANLKPAFNITRE